MTRPTQDTRVQPQHDARVQPHDTRRDWMIVALIIVAFSLLSFFAHHTSASPDLMATWMAGQYYAQGAFDLIYPADTEVFTVMAPQAWHEKLALTGYDGAVYPYIYPPLWAALTAPLTEVTSFATFNAWASLLNPALMLGCVVLALRITRIPDIAVPTMVTGVIVFFATWAGQLALTENQPQILVSFLMLLAIERARFDAPLTAGLALALAASIKVYPALFVPLFLAAGHRRAMLWFVPFGAGLGLSSIALTGWPLHATFLHQLSIITDTLLINPVNFAYDSLVGQLFFARDIAFVPRPAWYVDAQTSTIDFIPHLFALKSALWKSITSALMIGSIGLGTVLMWRAERWRLNTAWIWPLTMGLYALVGPLAWIYHFIPVIAFCAQLPALFGVRRGALILLGLFVPLSVPAPFVLNLLPAPLFPIQMAGCLSMTLLVLTCATAMRNTQTGPPQKTPV